MAASETASPPPSGAAPDGIWAWHPPLPLEPNPVFQWPPRIPEAIRFFFSKQLLLSLVLPFGALATFTSSSTTGRHTSLWNPFA